jgi:hypothetical protein
MNPPNVPNIPPSGGTPPPNMPPPAKPSGGMFTARNIIIGLVALIVLCVCGTVCTLAVAGPAIANIFGQVAAPSAVGVQFLTNIAAGDYDKAYALCSPALQRALGSPAALGKRIGDANAKPTAWTFSSTNLTNDRLELSGTATFTGGRSGTVSLAIIKVGGDWKVDAFNLTPQ